ncbi:hypothetical protein HX747_04055 [Streptomyces sp. L06]|nr:hypothetical protein [Streptomyces sp. L06]
MGGPIHETPGPPCCTCWFVAHGVAEYVITTLTPGRVHPALAPLLAQDG